LLELGLKPGVMSTSLKVTDKFFERPLVLGDLLGCDFGGGLEVKGPLLPRIRMDDLCPCAGVEVTSCPRPGAPDGPARFTGDLGDMLSATVVAVENRLDWFISKEACSGVILGMRSRRDWTSDAAFGVTLSRVRVLSFKMLVKLFSGEMLLTETFGELSLSRLAGEAYEMEDEPLLEPLAAEGDGVSGPGEAEAVEVDGSEIRFTDMGEPAIEAFLIASSNGFNLVPRCSDEGEANIEVR